jgi:hypothetical protein
MPLDQLLNWRPTFKRDTATILGLRAASRSKTNGQVGDFAEPVNTELGNILRKSHEIQVSL